MAGGKAAHTPARRVIQGVLRAGLACAVALMAAGIAVRLATHHSDTRATTPSELVRGSLDPGLWLLLLGVLVLAATPALRVVALAVEWAVARDWRFTAVALLVAGILVVAALVGSG